MADDKYGFGLGKSSRRVASPGLLLFLLAFVLGSLGILLLYTLGQRQWIVTAFPLLVMFLYMANELYSGRYEYREDRLGENLYYLGLLYTLVSLSHALYVFGAADAIGAIVSNFGIALGTTITGLALRVFMYQLGGDQLDEPELRARIELAEAVDRLKVQLSSCVEDVNGFRLQLAQSLAAMITNAAGEVTSAIQEGLADLRDKAASVKAAAEIALGSLPGHLAKLNQESGRLAAELENVWIRVANVQVPPGLLEQELAPAIRGLTRHARLVAKLTLAEEEKSQAFGEVLVKLTGVTEQVGQQMQATADSAASLADLNTQIREVHDRIGTIAGAVSAANNQLMKDAAEAAQVLHALASESAADLQAAKTNREALESELAKSRETLSKVQDSLLSMTSLIIHRLGNSGPRTEKSGL